MKTEIFAPFGSVLAAAGCPACFPALAGLASLFGIGALASYEAELLIATQFLVAVSMLFAWRSYRRTHFTPSLSIALVSGAAVFFSWYIWWNENIIYLGFAGLIITALWNILLERRASSCDTSSGCTEKGVELTKN